MKNERLSCGTWYCLCFISLAFTIQLRMFLPEYDFDSSSYALAAAVTVLAAFVAAIPSFLLVEHSPDILSVQGGCVGLKTAYGLVFLFLSAHAAAHFSLFLHLTLYPNTARFLTCAILVITALVITLNGITQLGRMSLLAAGYFVAVFAVMCAVFASEVDFSLMDPPASNGISDLFNPTRQQLFGITEISLIPWGMQYCDTKRKKPFALFILFSGLTSALSTLLIISPLGSVADRFVYPFYSALQIAGTASLQRPDIIYLTVWSLLAVMRTALYLMAACELLTPEKFSRKALPKIIVASLVLAGAITMVYNHNSFVTLRRLMYNGLVFIPAVVILPIVGLIIAARRRKKCEKSR